MKSPGIIYRRYRQLKRKLLYEKMQEARKKVSKNCVYGKAIDILDRDRVIHTHICLYNENIKAGLEVCNHACDCNAFICKFSKKNIEDEFNVELGDQTVRCKKYPELNVLEWVLDKTLDDATKEPTILVKIIVLAIAFLENLIKVTVRDQKRLMNTRI
jgi:hypothetical protein